MRAVSPVLLLAPPGQNIAEEGEILTDLDLQTQNMSPATGAAASYYDQPLPSPSVSQVPIVSPVLDPQTANNIPIRPASPSVPSTLLPNAQPTVPPRPALSRHEFLLAQLQGPRQLRKVTKSQLNDKSAARAGAVVYPEMAHSHDVEESERAQESGDWGVGGADSDDGEAEVSVARSPDREFRAKLEEMMDGGTFVIYLEARMHFTSDKEN